LGGTLITKNSKYPKVLLRYLKNQMIRAAQIGLYPDSEAVIFNPTKKYGKIYKCELIYLENESQDIPADVKFTEVEAGRIFPVAMAFVYATHPKKNEYIGMVHLHT